MSEIRAGDLVMVVRATPCCGRLYGLGEVYRVWNIEQEFGTRCRYCKKSKNGQLVAVREGQRLGRSVAVLRRLDPDALKDDIPQRDEVPA